MTVSQVAAQVGGVRLSMAATAAAEQCHLHHLLLEAVVCVCDIVFVLVSLLHQASFRLFLPVLMPLKSP